MHWPQKRTGLEGHGGRGAYKETWICGRFSWCAAKGFAERVDGRALYDGTNGIVVNKWTRIRDQEGAPIAADLTWAMYDKSLCTHFFIRCRWLDGPSSAYCWSRDASVIGSGTPRGPGTCLLRTIATSRRVGPECRASYSAPCAVVHSRAPRSSLFTLLRGDLRPTLHVRLTFMMDHRLDFWPPMLACNVCETELEEVDGHDSAPSIA